MSNFMLEARPLVGFRNLGNTCFVNSALQVLFSSKMVLERLISHKGACRRREGCVACAVATDYENIVAWATAGQSAPAPHATLKLLPRLMPGMVRGSQQDSHAFFLSLLNIANEELADRRILMGEQVYITVCNTCNFPREEAGPFWNIPVQVRESIEQSIDAYFATENLSGADKIVCRNCGTRSAVTRSLKLKISPEILIVQMARFEYVEGRWRRSASQSQFPKELDLGRHRATNSPARSEDKMRCLGVVVHSGQSPLQGHYQAIAVTTARRKFHLFNDSAVREISPLEALVRNDVYFAVYERMPVVTAGTTPAAQQLPPLPVSAPRALATSTPVAATRGAELITQTRLPAPTSTPRWSPLGVVADPLLATPPTPARPGPARVQAFGSDFEPKASQDESPSTFPPQRRFTLAQPARQYMKKTTSIPTTTGPQRRPSTSSGVETDVIRTYGGPRQRSSSTSSTTGPRRQREFAHSIDKTLISSTGTSFSVPDPLRDDSTPRGGMLSQEDESVPARFLTSGTDTEGLLAVTDPLQTTPPPPMHRRRGGRFLPSSRSPPEPSLPPPFTPSPVKVVDPTCAPSPEAKWTSRSDTAASARGPACRPVISRITLVDPWLDSSEDEACDRLPAPTACHEPVPARPFACPHCCFKFRDKRAQWRHVLRHSYFALADKRYYPCWHCPAKFRDSHELHLHARHHIAAGNDQSMLRCLRKSCDQVLFRNPDRLARHGRAHAKYPEEGREKKDKTRKREPHECLVCKAHFDECRDLRFHKRALGLNCNEADCKKCRRRREKKKKQNDLKERIEPWETHKKLVLSTIGLW